MAAAVAVAMTTTAKAEVIDEGASRDGLSDEALLRVCISKFLFSIIYLRSVAHETHEEEPSSATAAPLFFCSFIRYIRRKSMASETTKGKKEGRTWGKQGGRESERGGRGERGK